MKVKVNIEEHLVKTIEVNVNTDDPDKAIMIAENCIMDKYAKDEIKLTREDDFSGTTLVMTEVGTVATDWHAAYTPYKDDIPSDDMAKLINKNIIKICGGCDPSLPKNTIALSADVYEKYISNENSFYMVRYPILSTDQLIKLSDVDVVLSPFKLNYCSVSNDIALKMQLDFMYDVICFYYTNE